MEIHNSAMRAIDILERYGFEAHLVGGCVRDSLMGRAPHDWDICTDAHPEQTAACFAGFHVIETGLQHGTVTVVIDRVPVEITTYRVDGPYEDNRHPSSVLFVRSLREDLARRDFTMNALAYHPQRGIVDYFGGAGDIEAGVVRCVGDPFARFHEDGLRIMRALRFASRLGFSIAPDAARSLHSDSTLLRGIAAERLQVELCGLLEGGYVRDVLLAYPDVLAQLIPEIEAMVGFPQRNPYHDYGVWRHTVESIAVIPPQRVLRLAMLYHDIGKPLSHTAGGDGIDHFYGHPHISARIARESMRRLKFDNATRDAVCTLVKYHDAQITPKGVIRWMNRLGEEQFGQLFEVKRADILAQARSRRDEALQALDAIAARRDAIVAQRLCFSLRDLAVGGRDVIEAGIPPGPEVGRVLEHLLGLVMDGEADNDRDALLHIVRNMQ